MRTTRKCLRMKGRMNSKKILVVGSWAKAQITIENIRKKNLNINIFVYMSIKNPAIIPLVNGYKIGNFNRPDDIVQYAKRQNIDLVIVTTAEPLSTGLVDALEKENITVFGPKKQAAQLESDKAFMRELLKKYEIDAFPHFQIFKNADDAIQFAQKVLNWNVAVKPVGLTEGLGVKVFGDQLKTKDDVIKYVHQIFSERGDSKVLIEEKLVGEEFTIQCFVNDNCMISTPPVQDFKKLLVGEKGPHTASMGSYSAANHLLPFMKQVDYVKALDIMMKTLDAVQEETGETCRGFLYGQFMITEDGIKLIEYNFRPGDPEWMNTLFVLESNILEVIENLLDGEEISLQFENKATVCKYIVPPNYPKKLFEFLDVSFEECSIKGEGVGIYYSCGVDNQGRLNIGSERGIAFIAKENTIFAANEKVEQAISMVKGDFYHRDDIGTKELIGSKIAHVSRLRK
jgi:phosphoribosylamine--glycine ligase